jgi:hypothetical protein
MPRHKFDKSATRFHSRYRLLFHPTFLEAVNSKASGFQWPLIVFAEVWERGALKWGSSRLDEPFPLCGQVQRPITGSRPGRPDRWAKQRFIPKIGAIWLRSILGADTHENRQDLSDDFG